MAASAKDIVTRFLKAVEEGDLQTLEALQAPTSTWWVLGSGVITRAQYLDAVKSMLLTADRRKVDIIGMIAEGDAVAVEIESEMHFGDRVYRNAYHDLFVLKDGLIVHAREYLDTAVVAAFQQGAAEAPA